MKASPGRIVISLCICILFAGLPAMGQQGAVSFKHFFKYSAGEWSQEIQGFRGGVPLGPPQRSTTCASPLSPVQAATAVKLGNAAAPMCSMKVLKDEERTAEYEQSCAVGPQTQVIHSTMRSIGDRTMTMEIRHSIGGTEMSFSRITSHYQGPCTAEQTMPVMPAIPKPSAEECAEIAGMKKQAEEAMKSCTSSDTPEAERASCMAAMKRMSVGVQQMEALCK